MTNLRKNNRGYEKNINSTVFPKPDKNSKHEMCIYWMCVLINKLMHKNIMTSVIK